MLTITLETPLAADLTEIHARHHHAMHVDTPPESIHMMSPEALTAPDVRFFVLRDGGQVLGMGAWKVFETAAGRAGEIKSMHILAQARGRGLARQLLAHLMQDAKTQGAQQLFLETGAQESFTAARDLYLREGFAPCPPFGDYRPDPLSVFMTRAL